MKTTAIIDLGYMSADYLGEYVKDIRKHSSCDSLLVITTGNFKRSGAFTPVDFSKRFEAITSAESDLVIKQPVFATCLRNPYFNFSLTSFINKLRLIDDLFLPVADDTPDSLKFADKFTSDLRFSYSSVKCYKHKVPDGVFIKDSSSSEKDRLFMALVQDYFSKHADKNEMLEIFGGTDTLIDYLLAKEDAIRSGILLSETVDRISNELHSSEKILQYLLRCVMKFRKLDHSILALYEYSPYAHIIFENKNNTAVTDLITSRGYIQQVNSYRNINDCTKELNPSKQALYHMEKDFCRIFEQ